MESPEHLKGYHIFNPGDMAEVTGNGGVYNSSIEYSNLLGADMEKVYLNCSKHERTLPNCEFIVGRRVKVINRAFWGDCGTKICLIEVDGWQFIIDMEYLKLIKPINRGISMNKTIVELFPVTEEAVLVAEQFSAAFELPLAKIIFKGKEEEILKLARREAKEKENK